VVCPDFICPLEEPPGAPPCCCAKTVLDPAISAAVATAIINFVVLIRELLFSA
jgi:hypothetical protein